MIHLDLRDLATLPARLARTEIAVEEVPAELAPQAQAQQQKRFSAREAPDGTAWAPRKRRVSHPPLEQTGRLRRSIASRPDARGVEVRASAPYASFVGARRPFLGFGERDESELTATADRFLGRFVGGALR